MQVEVKNKKLSIPNGRLYINGERKDSQNGHTFPTINPATEEQVTKVAEASKDDVNAAIQAARNVFDNGPWPKMSGYERGRMLYKIGDLVLKYGEELAYRETIDMGMLYKDSVVTTHIAANMFYYYSGWSSKIEGSVKPVDGEFHTYTIREPL